MSIIILAMSCSSSFAATPGVPFHVTQVIDGNTISIRTKSFVGIPLKIERIRLIGIDAPELKQEQWGRLAKKHLKKIVSENCWVVNIEFDVQQRDRDGRLVAYLWNKKGELINEKLLESGYAVLSSSPPNMKYADRLAAAVEKARSERAGIWKKGGLKETPEQWRREHRRQFR
ncbi:MAG: thermonuclease family protein [Nitrospirae bacterium]|nr:thermonuclease family protein [Nitrospirota bacterium]